MRLAVRLCKYLQLLSNRREEVNAWRFSFLCIFLLCDFFPPMENHCCFIQITQKGAFFPVEAPTTGIMPRFLLTLAAMKLKVNVALS